MLWSQTFCPPLPRKMLNSNFFAKTHLVFESKSELQSGGSRSRPWLPLKCVSQAETQSFAFCLSFIVQSWGEYPSPPPTGDALRYPSPRSPPREAPLLQRSAVPFRAKCIKLNDIIIDNNKFYLTDTHSMSFLRNWEIAHKQKTLNENFCLRTN